MARQHGITSQTVERFLIDEGAVYKNYGTENEELLGATRGGNSWTIEQDVREIEMAGAPGPVKGGRRIIESRAQLQVSLLELTADNLAMALAGSELEDHTADGETDPTHDSITRKRRLQASDYLENIALVGEVSGRSTPAVFLVKNALADDELEIEMEDREEAEIEITFTAHFDPDNMEEEPWEVRWPKEAS